METPINSKTLISANSQPMVLGQAKYPAEISNVRKPKEFVDLDRSILWNVTIDPIADELAHQQNNHDY